MQHVAQVLLGEFIINKCEIRKIYENTATGVYIVTDSDNIAPVEIGDNVFCSLTDIETYYTKLGYSITIHPCVHGRSSLHAACE